VNDPSSPPDVEQLEATGAFTGPDGQLYKIEVTADAEVIRGPLGRFNDLAAQVQSEGLRVPGALAEALEHANGTVARFGRLAEQIRSEGLDVPEPIASALDRLATEGVNP
jgi:hypothetical protein